MKKVCLVPKVSGVGGMVSFRSRFAAGLRARGIGVSADIRNEEADAVLVIGGTRDLAGLWQAKRQGIRIVQRLDGMNWLHRRLKTGLRHYLRAEYGNLLLRFIRTRLADHLVYQSTFARDWWEQAWGVVGATTSIVHNAVDLAVYTPQGAGQVGEFARPDEYYRVLLVEGSLMGGYEMGLETAAGLVDLLNQTYAHVLGKPVELVVAGRVSEMVQRRWSERSKIRLVWAGLVPAEHIPALDRSAHLLYSADINAACPNAAIEALACGTPVLAFDTGALPELVTAEAGRVIPYGGDPWKLETPDREALGAGAVEILTRQSFFRRGARRRAEVAFDLDKMVAAYLAALFPD